MTKRKRWLLAVPLGVLAALVLFFALVFDWSWLKGVVEDQASAALGREVTIGDLDVDLDLDLTPRITVEGVRVANAPWAGDKPFAAVETAAVEVDLMALLGGEIILPAVEVAAPTLSLERSAGGEANWAFGGAEGEQEQSQDGEPSIPVIGDLRISDTTVHYVDHGSGEERTAALRAVEGALPEDGEQRLQASGEVDGAPLTLTASAASHGVLEPGSEPESFALDLKLGDHGLTAEGEAADLLAAGGIDATVRVESPSPSDLLVLLGLPAEDLAPLAVDAAITSEGETIRVDDLTATLGDSDLTGSGSVTLGSGPPQITADLRSSLIDLEQVRALWERGARDGGEVEAELSEAQAALDEAKAKEETEEAVPVDPELPFSFAALPDWTVEVAYRADLIRAAEGEIRDLEARARLADQVPFLRATGGGSYAGQDATLDARLGPDEGAADDAPYPIRVEARTGATRIDVEGAVAEPVALKGIDLRLDAASEDLNQLLAVAGVDAPAIPPFEVAGRIRQQDAVWSVEDLLARVGDSQIQGTASFDRSGERPLVTADITSSRLIAADFMPAAVQEGDQEEAGQEGGAAPADGEGGTPIVGRDGINLDALPDIDVEVSFAGDYVEVPDARFEPLRLNVRIVDKIPVVAGSGQGAFRDSPLDVEVRIGSEDFVADREAPYPFDVRLAAGDTLLTADGTVNEPSSYTGLDVEVAVEGPNLDQIGDILQISLPDTPPYSLGGQLSHADAVWTLEGLNGRVGDSDLDGRFSIDLGGERPMIVADLHSERLDFDDLAPLIGGAADPEETASVEQAAEAEREQRLLPDEPLEVPDLRRMDARVAFQGDNVDAPKLPLESVVIDLTLEDGKLRLAPLRFELAGGELDATIDLDATPRPMDGRFDIALRRVDVQRLLGQFDIEVAEIETQREGRGTLFGRTELAVRGNSIAEMLGHADGKLAVLMDGGQINALIVEGLGLDIGEALGLLVADEEERRQAMVPLNCFVAEFEVAGGAMRTRALVLDTEDSKITGAGEILLGEETLDLTLKAQARDASMLSAGTPVRVHGALTDPTLEIVSEELVEKGLAAAALGVVLPVVGAVLPFIETEQEVPSNCGPLLQQAREAGGSSEAAGN